MAAPRQLRYRRTRRVAAAASLTFRRRSAAPGQSLPVTVGRANAVLLFGDESREDFDSMKIAEIGRNAAGQPTLVESYLPPR